MSYSAPSGPQRKPGENLSAQGKPETTGAGTPPVPDATTPAATGPVKRSAGAPKRSDNRSTGKGEGRSGGKGPGKGHGKPGGKGHRGHPVKPVKVAQSRNWGSIAIFAVVGLLVVGIIGYGSWQAIQGSKTWQEKLTSISGVVDFTKTKASELAAGNGHHVPGRVQYFATPSVGGDHNARWQNCMGDIYPQQVANEHATHSLEHGAVWITYDPEKVPDEGLATLISKVRGTEYLLLSPFPGQGSPVSLQTWGYQLKVNSADDKRIDEFIRNARVNASVEPNATCSGGVTATGVEPQVDPNQPANPAPSGAPVPAPASPSVR